MQAEHQPYRHSRSSKRWGGIGAACWFAIVGIAFMAPTVIHGSVFAPFDLLNVFGLGHHSTALVHNAVDSDLIQQDVPWLKLEWVQIHSGHLPLWNPYSGEGMPLGLDFITASFSLPTIATFAFPVQYGLLVSVLVKLFIAGTGAYVLGRVIGLSRLSSAFVGTVFELCGAFTVWLGWSQTGVMAWAGWLLAAVYLVIRGRHRVRSVILLAVVFGCSILGGHPESTVVLSAATAVFCLVLLVDEFKGRGFRSSALRVFDLVIGVVAGLCLSAPLWIPGVQLSAATARFQSGGIRPLPSHDLLNFLFQGFDGLPLNHSAYFNPSNYYEVTSFIGVITVAFGLLALVTRWRRIEVKALAAVIVVFLAIIFLQPVLSLVTLAPHAGGVNWYRGLIPVSLATAALAGVGLEAFVKDGYLPRMQHTLGAIFAGFAVFLTALGVWAAATAHRLAPGMGTVRAKSFFWPGLSTACGIGVVALLIIVRRSHEKRQSPDGVFASRSYSRLVRRTAILLVGVETAFLVLAGGPLWTAGQAFFKPTSGDAALQRAVGSSTVGFGECPSLAYFPDLGILPEANIGFEVHEISFYDTAVAPSSYFSSWGQATGTHVQPLSDGVFCPSITTVALARRYGIAYVLEPPGAPGPPSSIFKGTIQGEGLYFIPGSGPATLSSDSPHSVDQNAGSSAGTQVVVAHPDDATWRMDVNAATKSTLHLRLTAVPGWRATVDGKPVAIQTWDSVMQSVAVPAGHHIVIVTYWPQGFTLGLVLAAVAALCLIIVGSLDAVRRRRSDARV